MTEARAGYPLRPFLLRAREVALLLGVSPSQVEAWRRLGMLTPVALPGIRAVRFSRDQVEQLARRWCAAAGVPAAPSADVFTSSENREDE
jgi:DNA-binding transcriptional MerR regulator